MGTLRDAVEDLLDRRLPELGSAADVLDDSDVEQDFGRRSILHPEYHRRVELGGEPLALTVTPVSDSELEDEAPVHRLAEELGRLSGEGHLAVMHQVMVGDRGSILVDVVGSQGSASTADESSSQRFAQALFDHDTVRGLLRDVPPA
jgi:hypothetical protein